MQEIAPHIFIETNFAGVTLSAINWAHGLILIDSPFRAEDVRSWRSALLNLGGGVDRLLINLDPHFDRTLGTRAMECTTVGQERMSQIFRSRPLTFKAQGTETGAEWELYNNLGSIRWLPPEITFTNRLSIHWDGDPLILEYHPGSAVGACWASLPDHRILFLGDAVVLNQPPFLAASDLAVWIADLKKLLSSEYHDWVFVSGRGGLVTIDEIRRQIQFLEAAQTLIHELEQKQATAEEIAAAAPQLLGAFEVPGDLKSLYSQRLVYGMQQYVLRRFHPVEEEPPVEE